MPSDQDCVHLSSDGATASLDARRVERVLSDVAAALWDEREQLEVMLFRLTAQQLIVSTRKTRWLKRADEEIERGLRELQDLEIVRAAHVDVVVRAFDLDPDASLAEVAAAAPEPWSMLLDEHREALRTLTTEVRRMAAENRRLLEVGVDDATVDLNNVSDTGDVDLAGTSADQGGC